MGGNAHEGQKTSLDPEQTVNMLKQRLAGLRETEVPVFF